jgi:hypothetical protein
VTPALTGNYWDAGNSGLLAGDRMLLDLYDLERRSLAVAASVATVRGR